MGESSRGVKRDSNPLVPSCHHSLALVGLWGSVMVVSFHLGLTYLESDTRRSRARTKLS